MSELERMERQFMKTQEFGARLVKEHEIDFALWAIPEAEKAKIRPASDWVQEVVDHFANPPTNIGTMLPWSKTQNNIRLRPGELSIWAGVNGHGKSMLLSQIMLDAAIKQSQKVCIASLEMRPISTLARMARQASAEEDPGPLRVRFFHKCLKENLWLYDQQGTVRHDRMLAVVRYCREALSVDHFVIDSLMKCGINGDDYNLQKKFLDCLSTYARDSGIHIHLVAHSRKKETEDRPMDKFDVKGAGEITDMADNVFTLWRNKPKETRAEQDEISEADRTAPDAVLVCDKQRHGEWEGKIALWFNKRALQYVGANTPQTINYLDFENFEQSA